MFGINGGEAAILVLLALILLGPEKLPAYARTAARGVKAARAMFASARERVREELGDDEMARELASLNPGDLRPSELLRRVAGPAEAPGPAKGGTIHWDNEAT